MSGFGGDSIKGRFVAQSDPGESAWDDQKPLRFWQNSQPGPGGQGDGSAEEDDQRPETGRRHEVPLTSLPAGMRPGERPVQGQANRTMSSAGAARAYRRMSQASTEAQAALYPSRKAAGPAAGSGEESGGSA